MGGVSEQEMAACGETLRRIERMIGVRARCVAGGGLAAGLGGGGGSACGNGAGMDQFPLVGCFGERDWRAHCESKSQERGAAVVARGVGRIFLIVLVAYVIFTYSVRGLVGFLAGLAMPVIAMMCEAVYEFVASNRRSS